MPVITTRLNIASSSSSKCRYCNETLTGNYNTNKGRKVRRESVEKSSPPANSAFWAAAPLFFGLFGKGVQP
jgi:hypothetical protein